MRSKTGLHFTAIFAPLLALVVGMALLLRSGGAADVGSRLRLVGMVVDEVFELDIACRQYVRTHGTYTRQDCEKRLAVLQRLFADLKMADRDEGAIFEKIRRNFDRLSDLFIHVPAAGAVGGAGEDKLARLETDLLRLSRTIVADTVTLAELSHNNNTASQQHADSLIIIFSAVIAVLMAVSAYMTVREELTRRQEMARELEQSNLMLSDAFVKLHRAEQGVHQERLQALESMARGIGYEIGSSLAPIVRISDTLLNFPEYLNELEKVRTGLVSINKSARSAKDSIERLTKFISGGISTGPRQVDVAHLVEEALSSTHARFAEMATHGAPVEIKSDLPPLFIEGYENEIREALVQVITNSVEAMPRGGVLTLTVEKRDVEAEAAIVIADTGRGMTEDVIRHCCEPFFSTKGETSSGMGLTIVSATVRRHGGHIDIKSKPGHGTTVSLILPLKLPVTAAPVNASEVFEIGSLKILVIDDQPWIGQTLNDLLTEDGHRVECATGGDEGLRKIRSGGFDLLITDRAMPDMNGEQVANAVRKMYPSIRIILLTGFGEIIKDAGVSSSAVDLVISKPVTPETLRRGIVEAMRKNQVAADANGRAGKSHRQGGKPA